MTAIPTPVMGWSKAMLFAALVALGASALFFVEDRKESGAATRGKRQKKLLNVSVFDGAVAHVPWLAANENVRYFANFAIFVFVGTIVGFLFPYPLTNFRQAMMAGFAWTTIFIHRQ